MKRLLSALIPVMLIIGIGLMAYPTVSDLINRFMNNRALRENEQYLDTLDDQEMQEHLDRAHAYNRNLTRNSSISDAFSGGGSGTESQTEYMSLLNLNGDGIMGSIIIPKINVNLPIYHTTQTDVLRKGVGHVEGTDLPVGGTSTHCAIAGHRGLPSARLFTDLDQMEIGDTFTIQVLRHNLIYAVDQIVVVEPTETQYLERVDGEDYVTLVTCTPYSINTHRLLIRGSRVLHPEQLIEQDAVKPIWLYGVFIGLMTFAIFLLLGVRRRR